MILYLRDAIPNLDHLRSGCNPCNSIINRKSLELSVKNMSLGHSENLLIQLEHELVLRVDIEFCYSICLTEELTFVIMIQGSD